MDFQAPSLFRILIDLRVEALQKRIGKSRAGLFRQVKRSRQEFRSFTFDTELYRSATEVVAAFLGVPRSITVRVLGPDGADHHLSRRWNRGDDQGGGEAGGRFSEPVDCGSNPAEGTERVAGVDAGARGGMARFSSG